MKQFFQNRKLQLWLVPLIALVVSNVVSASPLPFTVGYVFPTVLFVMLYMITNLAWELHTVAYSWLNRQLPFNTALRKRIVWQILVSVLITFCVYSLVFTVKTLVFQSNPSLNGYIKYLSLALAIAATINLGYIIQGLQNVIETTPPLYIKTKTAPQNAISLVESAEKTLLIETGSRLLQVAFDDIFYFASSGGLVIVVKNDQTKLTTNWNAFSKFTQQLPTALFFQVNRQFIVHRQAVVLVKDDTNRKLNLTLQCHPLSANEPIVISRYRRTEFLDWFKMQTV